MRKVKLGLSMPFGCPGFFLVQQAKLDIRCKGEFGTRVEAQKAKRSHGQPKLCEPDSKNNRIQVLV